MFIALFGTFIASFAEVFWKKSLSFGLRPIAHNLASYPMWVLFFAYFLFVWIDLSGFGFLFFIIVVFVNFLNIVLQPLVQKVYREEKISVIMPFTNLNKIFVIIASFFIFQDVSILSFFIILFTVLIIILASFDFKNKTIPKNFSTILAVESIKAADIFLSWWLVVHYGEVLYFNVTFLVWLSMYLAISLYTWQIQDIKDAPLGYWKVRIIWALWWVSWFLSLIVVSSLGLSLSVLLWFLWIWVTLFVAYFFLGDTPSKKNILLTISVALLIGTWFYFK